MKRISHKSTSLILLSLIIGRSASAQEIESFLTDEEVAQMLKSRITLDCDLEKTPWNSFKVTVYEKNFETVHETLEFSPLTRRAFQDPRLRPDDEKLLSDFKARIKKIEATAERLPSGKLFPDEQAEIKQIQDWIKSLEAKNQTILNTPKSNLQGTGVLHLIAAYNVGANGPKRTGDALEALREQVVAEMGEVLDSFPCETKNLKVCAEAQPDTSAVLFNKAVVDDSKLPEEILQKKYKRIHILKIDHCLKDYPMSDVDRKTINDSCQKWPDRDNGVTVDNNDTAYRFIRAQFRACSTALNAFLDKQAGLPRKNGKYIPGTHKN